MIRKFALLGVAVLSLNSCSYHVVNSKGDNTIGIPFVPGDKDGLLTKAITQEISTSGLGEFRSRNTRFELVVKLEPDFVERIGYRYDRLPDGTLRPNIIGTETRRTVTVSYELIDTLYDKVVFGPKSTSAFADFDYLDTDNIADMSFVNPLGQRILAFNYSLGQLNTIEGATDASLISIYRMLSKNIADELALYFNNQN
jgi:hypothetical protein